MARLLTEGPGKTLPPEVVGKYPAGDIHEPKVFLEQGIPELRGLVREQNATERVDEATVELESRQLVR
jgi:hypothetical protein